MGCCQSTSEGHKTDMNMDKLPDKPRNVVTTKAVYNETPSQNYEP